MGVGGSTAGISSHYSARKVRFRYRNIRRGSSTRSLLLSKVKRSSSSGSGGGSGSGSGGGGGSNFLVSQNSAVAICCFGEG